MNRSWLRLLFVMVCSFALVFAPLGGSAISAGQGPDEPPAPAAAQPGIAPGWLVQRADSPVTFSNMSPHSLRLSADGSPRLVYGGDHLYFAYKDTAGWHTETADGAWSVGSGAALALDAAGKAHVSYYDSAHRALKYATNKSGAWAAQTVGSSSGTGFYSDIAIDSTGDPAIVYYDSPNESLRYIRYDSEYGGWGPDELIATGLYNPGHTGWFSFALNTSILPNKPHVSFFKTTSTVDPDGDLYYARYSQANAWEVSYIESCTAPDVCRTGEYNAIALDPVSKMPSVAYSYTLLGNPVLVYGAYNGSIFSFNIIDSAIPKYITLAMDSTGMAHVTYQYNGFKYLRQTATGPTFATAYTIDSASGAGQWSSLAVVGVLAHVSHYNPETGQLRFVDHDRSGWLAPYTVVTQGASVGRCASLAVDTLGRSHTSYFDETNKYLLYTRYDGSVFGLKRNIDTSGTAGCFSVIAISPINNSPVVGLIKGGDLYYAQYSATAMAWGPPTLVDTAITLGYDGYQDFGFAMRSDARPVFAYRKGDSLMTATWNGTAWTIATVTSGSIGSKLALALDGSNSPHILFYQANHLSHAFVSGITWRVEPILGPGSNGVSFYGATLAAGPNGKLAAAFLLSGGWKLHYAERTNDCDAMSKECLWTPPVLVDEKCEEYFSLAVDRRGTPHAACMALLPQDISLHYITRKGSTWSVLQVDGTGWVGGHPGLGLSPSGKPRISYQDQVNDDLKFALAWDTVYLPVLKK